MASDMRKPLGITILRKQEIAKKLWPLGIEEMFGIGKKSVPQLQKAGIWTIGDVADPKNEALILRLLGEACLYHDPERQRQRIQPAQFYHERAVYLSVHDAG